MDKRDPEEFDSKVVVGTLLSITTPEKDQSYSAKNYTGDKKVKLGPKPSAIMLVFGDFYNKPNCFCLFVERKINFQRLFGNNFRLCETVRVGDVFFIKDPEPSNAMLGESLIILRDPTAIGVLVSHREYAWPAMPMSQSTEANHQVFFSEGGKLIQLTKPQLIRWGDVAKCGNYTCDRQAHCKGCFGAAPTRKPIVMTCAIKVKETPNYDHAVFRQFSSLRFTEIFFRDLEELSAKHISVIAAMYASNKKAIIAMVDIVNGNGGWYICGWHRQGVRTEKAGEDVLSGITGGHITMLQPTRPEVLLSAEFKALMIDAPNDNTVPELVTPSQGIAGDQRVSRDDSTIMLGDGTSASRVADQRRLAEHIPEVANANNQERGTGTLGETATAGGDEEMPGLESGELSDTLNVDDPSNGLNAMD
jgi:hypothetical protein